MEHERKFILEKFPSPDILGKGEFLRQGYLLTKPYELRIRHFKNKYYITVKGSGTLSRQEWEKQIPKWVFEALWPNTESCRIEKTRYFILFKNVIIEVDEFHKKLKSLFLLECEFPDEEIAKKFHLPFWAKDAKEVTGDKRYHNKYLALNGLPK